MASCCGILRPSKKLYSASENADWSNSSQTDERLVEFDPDSSRIRLLCWNIEGLENKRTLVERTTYICDLINKEKPHVVFLQEVVPETLPILREQCKLYEVIPGGDRHYFTAIMIHTHHVRKEGLSIKPFPNSQMLRNLLSLKCTIKGVKLQVVTSHLESTMPAVEERKSQLRIAFKNMQAADSNRTIIFGGDLNVVDLEVREVGGPPDGILDVWEATGKNPATRYTWDGSINDNLSLGRVWRNRLDRLYIRHSKHSVSIKPVTFELVGTQRLPCGQFPSDHFGLLTEFEKVTKNTRS